MKVTNQKVREILDFNNKCIVGIGEAETIIEQQEIVIESFKSAIALNNKRLFFAFNLIQNEILIFTQHEHFGECGGYSAYFQQEVEIRGFHINQKNEINFGISRKGRKTVSFIGIYKSFSLHKLDGTPIFENKLEHVRMPEPVSQEQKERSVEMQKI